MNKFIKSTLILIIGSGITKVISMIIRIVLNRMLGVEGIGIYMLILPTFTLLISISQLSLSTSISKLVSEGKRNNRNLVFSILPISLLFNIFLMFIVIFLSKFISLNLLKNENTYYGILSISFTLPFICISNILRGYFFGKEKMLPHAISNIIEDLVRLIIIILGVPIMIKKGITYAICFVILSNIFSELSSILVLFLFLPKNFKLNIKDCIPNKIYLKEIMNLSIPSTLSRIVLSIGLFLEPIIITNLLLYLGYKSDVITTTYGIINGYSLSLLSLPSVFSYAISTAIIPVISKAYSNKNIIEVKRKIKQGIYFSLLIGIPCSIIFFIFSKELLLLIYNTSLGSNYVKVLSLFFIFQYINNPITASITAMGYTNINLKNTIINIIFKLITLSLFIYLFHINGIIISIIISTIFSCIYNDHSLNRILKV